MQFARRRFSADGTPGFGEHDHQLRDGCDTRRIFTEVGQSTVIGPDLPKNARLSDLGEEATEYQPGRTPNRPQQDSAEPQPTAQNRPENALRPSPVADHQKSTCPKELAN
jgi:hypothetical protein